MTQLVYGRNLVISAIENHKVKELILVANFKDQKIIQLAKEGGLKINYVSIDELNKMTNNASHQGIAAKVETYAYSSFEEILSLGKKKTSPLVLILDELNDPHNFGAILRSADAFGITGIIIKKNNQVPLNATVAKTSTGAINYVKVAQVSNLSQAIQILKDNGYWIVATDGNAKIDYRDVDYKVPIGLIIGSEGFGISPLLLKRSDYIVKIPMYGHVNSLNASVATSILLAEISYIQNK